MHIMLNGERREVPEGCSLATLLDELKIHPERVAVEVNLNIVDRSAFGRTTLCDGDRVEVIGFIGGGQEART
jgi:thiamine biosynthesis protein ThiS